MNKQQLSEITFPYNGKGSDLGFRNSSEGTIFHIISITYCIYFQQLFGLNFNKNHEFINRKLWNKTITWHPKQNSLLKKNFTLIFKIRPFTLATKDKHKIDTKTKHDLSSGTCKYKTTIIFLRFVFCFGLCFDYVLMLVLMPILMSQAWLHSFVLPFVCPHAYM